MSNKEDTRKEYVDLLVEYAEAELLRDIFLGDLQFTEERLAELEAKILLLQ
jgi:hypothetical protein